MYLEIVKILEIQEICLNLNRFPITRTVMAGLLAGWLACLLARSGQSSYMVRDRNESLQVNSRWKALDEIYKIYKLLHRSASKNCFSRLHLNRVARLKKKKEKREHIQLNFVKHFRIFAVRFSKYHSFSAIVVQISSILMTGVSASFVEKIKIS